MPDHCKRCNLWQNIRCPEMKLEGGYDSEILFIGEAPGELEDELGRPFVGRSGTLLRDAIWKAKITSISFTNMVRCRPPGNRNPKKSEIQACKQNLDFDIERMVNLKLIVAIGNISLKGLFGIQGITKLSGKLIQKYKGIPVIPIMHPAYVLRNPQETKKFYDHVARIPNAVTGNLVTADDLGKYTTITSSSQFEELVEKIKEYGEFVYDIETSGLNIYSGNEYVKCIGFSIVPRESSILPVTGHWDSPEDWDRIRESLSEVFESKRIGKIGHGLKYDNLFLRHNFGLEVRNSVWDTQISQYVLNENESQSLKDLAWRHTKIGGYENKLTVPVQDAEGEELYRYCLEEYTKVLMADLSYKEMKDIRIGDELISFDEEGTLPRGKYLATTQMGSLRAWKFSTVTAIKKLVKPCFQISSPEGVLIGTADHKILSFHKHGGFFWKEIGNIKYKNSGREKLVSIGKCWEEPVEYDKGWLSGIFDGEGCIHKNQKSNTFTISMSQNDGIVLEEVKRILEKYGFNYTLYSHTSKTCKVLHIKGGLREQLRFLGEIRPKRLLTRALSILRESSPAFWTIHSSINNVEDMGYCNVIDISTTTKTFIANGFAVHNCGTDCDVTNRIYKIHLEEINKYPPFAFLMKTLLMPALQTLANMESKGMLIDMDAVLLADGKIAEAKQAVIQSIENEHSVRDWIQATGEDFNPNSPTQLREILFRYEGLPVIKETEKTRQPSTDKEVLEELSGRSNLCGLLLRYSHYNSLVKFTDGLKKFCDKDNRVHTQYNLTRSVSRTSSSNPNLQNIPRGARDLVGIRRCFIAEPGYYMVECDYNQHELRVMAELAGDETLKYALLTGDVHRVTAAGLLGKRIEDITNIERDKYGKIFNFGFIYGMTTWGIMARLGCANRMAESLLEKFFFMYQKTAEFMKHVERWVLEHEYIETPTGRRRRFTKPVSPGIHASEKEKKEYVRQLAEIVRQAINMPIQATAGDILLYSLIGVEKLLRGCKSYLSWEVHDSLGLQVKEEEMDLLPKIKEIILTFFLNYLPNWKMPLDVDIKYGRNWEEMEKWKE